MSVAAVDMHATLLAPMEDQHPPRGSRRLMLWIGASLAAHLALSTFVNPPAAPGARTPERDIAVVLRPAPAVERVVNRAPVRIRAAGAPPAHRAAPAQQRATDRPARTRTPTADPSRVRSPSRSRTRARDPAPRRGSVRATAQPQRAAPARPRPRRAITAPDETDRASNVPVETSAGASAVEADAAKSIVPRGDAGGSAGDQTIEAAPLAGNRPPRYPRAARRRGLEGQVVLQVRVSRSGAARAVEVFTTSGHGLLDAAAVDAVREWRFSPGRRSGAITESLVRIPITFRLEQAS